MEGLVSTGPTPSSILAKQTIKVLINKGLGKGICIINLEDGLIKNEPAAQAADADPSQCNSTDRQIHPFIKWP